MFYSQTYGKIELKDIPNKLKDFYTNNKMYERPFNIIIGTDSQTNRETKVVTVISILCEGHGGIFFYKTKKIHKIIFRWGQRVRSISLFG